MSVHAEAPSASRITKKPSRFARWHRRVLTSCLVVCALEIGVFLTVLPWRSSWDQSWIPVHSPRFANLWMSPYFRAALSGLGLLNIYIGAVELLSQLKSMFAPR
jgi:hypothetical protein